MRGTNDTKKEFDNIPVAEKCSPENTYNSPIVDAYQSHVVDSKKFTESSCNQRLQAPVELIEPILDSITYNVLSKLGARDSQIDYLSEDDLKKFSKYKKILKKFGVFGLNFNEIETFSESRLENFSKHLDLFNDLKEYMDKIKTFILDRDKAEKIKRDVKIFIVRSDSENLNNLINSLETKSELTHSLLYLNRLFCVFTRRGSHLADRIDGDFRPLLDNGQPVKTLSR
tara:strand:+ start:523 stop:1206 length:684 start_codon:yes stop_codon:yes gene_type:complete